MLLCEIRRDVSSGKTVMQQLQGHLPRDIVARQAKNSPNEIRIEHKNGPFSGLDFFKAFGFNHSSKNTKDNDADYEDDENGEDEDQIMWDAQNAHYAEFSNIVKKIHNIVPEGWRIASSICSYERDEFEPYVSIQLELDYNRKSRSKSDTWYHVTLASNVENIRQNGLVPKSNIRGQMDGYKDKTFLLSANAMQKKPQLVIDLARNLQSKPPVAWGDNFSPPAQFSDVALLKITLPADVVKRLDPSANNVGGVYIKQEIPPQQIQVVYQGPIDGLSIG